MFDVGANHGFYGLFAAASGAQVGTGLLATGFGACSEAAILAGAAGRLR
jgi:hypothetical protein